MKGRGHGDNILMIKKIKIKIPKKKMDCGSLQIEKKSLEEVHLIQ